MRITPRAIKSIYGLLRTTRPFCDWELPKPSRVRFFVDNDRDLMGSCTVGGGDPPEIRVSRVRHKSFLDVTRTVGHEMCHLHEMRTANRRGETLGDAHDTPEFLRYRNLVVKHNPTLFKKGDF